MDVACLGCYRSNQRVTQVLVVLMRGHDRVRPQQSTSVHLALRVQGLAKADFVIEAVRESEDIKRSVFMRLDQVSPHRGPLHHTCVIVTGTCTVRSRCQHLQWVSSEDVITVAVWHLIE